ncbi:LysE family transporter [candidate division KSB1 bacterium]|nr:LysE family transporter [candidate division KSB1 bacterium]
MLCGFGLLLFFKKMNRVAESQNLSTLERAKSLFFLFTKGALVNITNPTIFVFWLTLTALITTHYGFHTTAYWQFFLVLFGTTLAFDLIKVYLFSRMHNFLPLGIHSKINRALGFVLLCIGLFFIAKTLVLLCGG